jgi:hypothetical protein
MTKESMLLRTVFLIAIVTCISLSTCCSTQISAQTSPATNTITSPAATGTNVTSASSAGASQLIQKIERIPSLSNIIGMSMVEGIKVSGLLVGDTDLTVTLKRQTAGSNISGSAGNASSIPVTIIVAKLPVANLTQLLSTAQSTLQVAAANRAAGSIGPLFSGTETSPELGNEAIQILSLMRNIQIGSASIVNSNWTTPQTVSMGLLGMSNAQAPLAANEFVLVLVIPFQGITGAPTLPLR